MNIVSDVITYGLSNLWTSILFFWLLHSLFIPLYTSKYLLVSFTVVMTILTTVINIISPTIEINMIAYLAVIVLATIFFVPRFQAMFIGFYFFFSHLLIEDIVVIAFSLMGQVTYDTAMDINMIIRIVLMVIVEMLFLFCTLLVKPKIKIIQENKRYFSYWSISLIMVTISLIILHFTTINAIPNERISISQLVNAIILYCIMHFLLICLGGVIQFDVMKAENRQLQTISQYYADKVTESIESQNNNQKLMHDLRKVFYAIQIMADKRDIEGIKDIVISHSEIINRDINNKANTGIPEIDDIVNHLLSRVKNDVEYTFASVVSEPLMINSRDCIVLIGNLLDNAIEAVQKVDSNKIINIKITIDRNIFHIEVINSYNGKLKYDDNGNLITLKINPNEHGYGLQSIDNIVEKYMGTSDFIAISPNIFSSSVILFQSGGNPVII